MMSTMQQLLALSLGLLLAAGSGSGLNRLMLDGQELHSSLTTRSLAGSPIRHVPREQIQQNPQLSNDAEFVKAIARSGSQGNLDGTGINSALYALYDGEKPLGFYGLEAKSLADADRRENALRSIWSHNLSIDRARIHRQGLVVVVVWTDGVPAEVWEAVNAKVAKRLLSP